MNISDMKHHYLLPYLILLIVCFSSCYEKTIQKNSTNEKLDEKTHPYEEFYLQRSYPDDHFNLKAFEMGLLQARSLAMEKVVGFGAEWTVQGPGNIGARANTIAVHPENENIVFTGFSTGGVWRMTDGGANWVPVFDDQLWPAVADIAFDPSNPNTIYVATGDQNISGYPLIGDGLYKSTDGGDTWTNIGLSDSRVLSEVIVHPNNPNTLYVASMGAPFERDNFRGLYRTLDGGENWEQVLFVSDSTGIIDIQMDPFNPAVIYASGWDRVRNNQESLITGDGAKVFKTTDGGDTWTILDNGLPKEKLSRTGLAHSQITPNLVYAMYVGTDQRLYGIYKSTDAGTSWSPIGINGAESALATFGWYFGKLRTHPQNDDELFLLGVDLWRGYTDLGIWERATPEWWLYDVHADKHDLVFGPNNSMYLATDGGLYRSNNLAQSWFDIENIPTTQFYRVAFNPHEPEWYYGGAQDNGTSGDYSAIFNEWPRIYGGDGFQPAFHPTDPNVFYCETQNGNIVVTTDGGDSFFSADDGIDSGDRRNWDMPYLISAHNPDVLYAGTFRVYKSETGVVPDFYPISGQLTDDVTLHQRYHSITTLSESPIEQGLLFVGTVDANVWRTEDDGNNWVNITAGLPTRYVTDVQASPFNPDWVYVTHSGYKDYDFLPRIHRSKDKGNTWENISSNLPDLAINAVFVLPNHEDSILFVANDAGVYGTLNSGATWQRLGANMPFVPTYDLALNPAKNTLMAGTFARSIMTYPIDSLISSPPPDTSVAVNGIFADKFRLEVFPNPAKHEINVVFPGYPGKTSEVVIFDGTGKKWLTQESTGQSKVHFKINISRLPAGQYFIKGKSGHLIRSGKFVKY